MQKQPKNIQKSIRMTDEVFNIVDKMNGDGFNEKFENLVLKYKKEEKEIQKRIDFLLEQEKRHQAEVDKNRNIMNDLGRISNQVSHLINLCNSSKYQQADSIYQSMKDGVI